ncbi:aspartate 1-decarboxylase [Helicobacter bilis ATCC 43879]|uniref:Aspartate 1-decarboxylase n=2 Tax=Helicobacteraceae TaxID=72293 RepID=C3XFI9_9HELI|nr:aspartate 1-decarboxylase [Helicobacter bilis ATCC 43879]
MAKEKKEDKNLLQDKIKLDKIQKGCYVEMMYAKIHRAVVTDANLNYVGSISIDESIMESSGIIEGMKVDIVNVNNGERFSTYAIKAKAKSGTMCLNGAAARKVQKGDIVIIIAYASMKMKYAKDFKPQVVLVDSKNRIVEEH